MDLLKNKGTYQDYLNRIEAFKKISDINSAFSSIYERADQMLARLKNKEDKQFYKNVHTGIIVASVLVGIWCFWRLKIFLGLLNLVAAAGSKYFYTQILKRHISEANAARAKMREELNFKSQLFHKLSLVEDAIQIKLARISTVRYSFMVQFGIIMISSIHMFSLTNQSNWIVVLALATVMSTGFWFYFFKDDVDDLEYQQMEISTYIESHADFKDAERLDRSVFDLQDLEEEKAPVKPTIEQLKLDV